MTSLLRRRRRRIDSYTHPSLSARAVRTSHTRIMARCGRPFAPTVHRPRRVLVDGPRSPVRGQMALSRAIPSKTTRPRRRFHVESSASTRGEAAYGFRAALVCRATAPNPPCPLNFGAFLKRHSGPFFWKNAVRLVYDECSRVRPDPTRLTHTANVGH